MKIHKIISSKFSWPAGTRYLINSVSWIIIDKFSVNLISLGLALALANLLDPQELGIYRYAFSIVGAFQFLLFNRINLSIVRSVAQGEEGALKSVAYFRLRWGFIFTITILVIASYYYLVRNDYLVASSLFIFAIFHPIFFIFQSYGSYLKGKKDFKTLTAYNLTATAFTSGATIIALFISNNLLITLLTFNISDIIINLVLFRKTLIKYKPNDIGGKKCIEYGKHLTFMKILGQIATYTDNLIMFNFWGAQTLAQYAIIKTLPGQISKNIKLISNEIILPKFSEKSIKEVRSIFYCLFVKSLIMGIIVGGLYAIIAPLVFKIIFPLYYNVAFYSQILAIEIALSFSVALVANAFLSQKMIYAGYLTSTIPSVIKIITIIVLGIIGGLKGMVLAMVISKIFGVIFNISIWEIESRKKLRLTATDDK